MLWIVFFSRNKNQIVDFRHVASLCVLKTLSRTKQLDEWSLAKLLLLQIGIGVDVEYWKLHRTSIAVSVVDTSSTDNRRQFVTLIVYLCIY